MPESCPPGPIRLATGDETLIVEFRWQDDRFVHRVLSSGGGELSSVDGHADEAWPPSPPLQQLSQESIGEQELVFGVGLAGQSHWSVSVEIVDRDGQPGLKFDWACRCKQTPKCLGSTYSTSPDLRLEPSPGTALRASADGQQRLEPAEFGGPGTHQWTYIVTVVS